MTKTESAPLIGDHTTGTNAPRLPRKSQSPASPDEIVDNVEKQLKEETKEDASEEDVKKSYEDKLKEVDLTVPEARTIMDKVLTQGYYEETYKIGSVEVGVRTRSYDDTLRAQRYLELESPSYAMSINELIARYNIAAALSRFGEREFDFDIDSEDKIDAEEAFQTRYRFLVKKPAIVVSRLMAIVHKFDKKMAAVFSDEAPEDF